MDKKGLNELYGKSGLRSYQQAAVDAMHRMFDTPGAAENFVTEFGLGPRPGRTFTIETEGKRFSGVSITADRFFMNEVEQIPPFVYDIEVYPNKMYPHEVVQEIRSQYPFNRLLYEQRWPLEPPPVERPSRVAADWGAKPAQSLHTYYRPGSYLERYSSDGLYLQQLGRALRPPPKPTYFTINPLRSARLWAMAKKLRRKSR